MAYSFARFEEIRREEPDVHALLEATSAALLSDGRDSAAPYDISVAERAIELGYLERIDQEFRFADATLRNLYLVQHTVARVVEAWHSDEGFSSRIDLLQHRAHVLGIESDLGPEVLLALVARNKDVLGRVAELARLAANVDQPIRAFWSLYHPFCEALPDLDPDPTALAVALEAVLEAVAADLTNGLIHSAVRNLASRSRGSAEALLAEFLAYPGDRVRALAGDALLALAQFDLEEAHRRGLALTESLDSVLQRTGIVVIGNLSYSEAAGKTLLWTTFERLATLREQTLPDADHALASAYGSLLPYAEARKGLVDLADRRDAAVQYSVCMALVRNPEEAALSWFGDALKRIGRTAPALEYVLRPLDLALAKRAEHDPSFALYVLEEWVAAGGLRSRESSEDRLPDSFPTTFRWLREHAREPLQDAVTRWWVGTTRSLYEAAWQVVGLHDASDGKNRAVPLTLSPAVLSGVDEASVINALYHIMGHVIGGRPMSVLLLSALSRDPCPPSLVEFVTGVLDEVVLYTYPGDASEYLSERLIAADVSDTEAEVIRTARARSEEYFSARSALTAIPELRPPSNRVALLRREQGKHTAKIMEEARSRSAFLNLVTRVPLKYGRGFSIQRDGEVPAPTQLNSFSYEAELPRAPYIDPVGEAARRVHWRTIGADEESELVSKIKETP